MIEINREKKVEKTKKQLCVKIRSIFIFLDIAKVADFQ